MELPKGADTMPQGDLTIPLEGLPSTITIPKASSYQSEPEIRRNEMRKHVVNVIVGLFVAIVFGLVGCASPTQRHAMDISKQYAQDRFNKIGEISEHVIDMRENAYVFLDNKIASFKDHFVEEMKAIAFQGFLISFIHYKTSQKLARTWDLDNAMRKSLEKTYGSSFDRTLFDTPKAAFYFWTNFQKATGSLSPKQSWLYIGSKGFGRDSLSEVTQEDVTSFLTKIANTRKWSVKVKYLGTAKIPPPPIGWGQISYFDLIDMKPLIGEAQ